MNSRMLIGFLVIIIVGALAIGGYAFFKKDKAGEGMTTQLREVGGHPTGLIITDDGAQTPKGVPGVAPVRGSPYQYMVPGHGVGYEMYVDPRTRQMWAYGKNGQTRSPFKK